MKTKTKAQLTAELETAQNRIAELEQAIRANMRVESGEKERLSLALDAAQAGAWEWELRTNKNTWSTELWKLYGLEPYCCEPSYDVWRDTIHPEDRPQAEQAVQAAAQNMTSLRAEWRVVDRDGSIRWLMSHGEPILDSKGQAERFVGVVIDITERKQAEEALERTRNMLAEAQKIAHLGSFEYIAATQTTVWSEEEYRIYGLDPSEPSPEYEVMLRKCIHPDDAELLHEFFTRAMQNNSIYELEHRIVRPDGSVRWVYDRAHPFLNERGEIIRYVGTTLDITERKRAESQREAALEKLRESNTQYHSLIEALDVSLCRWQPDTTLTYANEKYKKIFDIQGEAIGQKWINFLPEETRDSTAAFYEEVAENPRTVTYEHPATTEESGVRMYHWIDTPILDEHGGVIEFQSVGIDVTERRLAEEQVRIALTKYQTLFDTFPLGITVTDTTGKILESNRIAEELVGLSKEEQAKRQIGGAEWRVIRTDGTPMPADEFASVRALKEGRKVENVEMGIVKPDESITWINVTAAPLPVEGYGLVVAYGDITVRKQADKLLQEARDQFQHLFDLSPIATTFTSLPERLFVDVNRATETLIGYSRDELIGRSTMEFDIFAVPEERAEILRLLSAQGRVNGVEAQIKTKRGDTLTCLMYIEVMNLQGRLYSLTQLVDVTEQRKIEKTLAETEYKYRTLVEQSPVVVYIAGGGPEGGEGQWQYLSPQVERVLGYSQEEYQAHPELWYNGVHPEDAERIRREADESMRQGLPIKLEYRMYARDGRMVWIHDEAQAVTDPASGKSVLHGIFYNITERKWMEHLLEKNERNYRELVQNANSAIIRWRSDGTIVFFNEYAQSFFGYSAGEVVGKHVNIIIPRTESTGSDLSGLVQEIVAHPEKFVNNVNENICKDGRRVWMVWTNKPIYNESGQLEEILAVGVDITDRKRIEDELRRSNAELEQFAYVASHDLQEPLRAMAGMVRLLQKRYQGQLDARADEYIGHAVESSTRMQTLIQDLLEYSRVDRRGRPIATVSAESCLQAALKNLGAAIQESHAEIISDPLPTVHADSTQLTQLFQNLIGNSIKFRGEKVPRVQVTATKSNGVWQFAVHDNGIGIESQYFERIFLVFQRLHTRREYQGTGIGLALCKKIVERHGGSIWLESRPGEGSTFYFTLPIKE